MYHKGKTKERFPTRSTCDDGRSSFQCSVSLALRITARNTRKLSASGVCNVGSRARNSSSENLYDAIGKVEGPTNVWLR